MSEKSGDRRSAPNRCRLVLVLRAGNAATGPPIIEAALAAGDVASVILWAGGLDETAFIDFCGRMVPVVQNAGAAAMVVNDSRAFGRSGADGFHVDTGEADIRAACDRLQPAGMVGAGGLFLRHTALTVGEYQPDYVFFGKLDGDTKPHAHPKTLSLAGWWAALIEIPCIGMGGAAIESAIDIALTGAEFAALSSAIFDGDSKASAAGAVSRVNRLLDAHAPKFDDV